ISSIPVSEENQPADEPETVADNQSEEPVSENFHPEESGEGTESEDTTEEEIVNDNTVEEEPKSEDAVGEETEVEDTVEEEIPFKNYETLPVAVLVDEARTLLKNHPARKVREHLNQIRDAVKKALEEDEAARKQAFAEEGGEASDFH